MDIDLIYANAPRTFFWGTIAAKISGTPIIWHLHSIIKGIELKLCLFISKLGIDKILAISLSVAEPFIRNNKRLSSRIEIIYNGVDTKKYSPSSAGKKIRHELGLSDGDKVVGYIGQIAKWKGVEVFVNAASEVLAARQNVIFLVVGDVLFGGKGAVDFKKHILDIVQRLNMTGNVKFLGKRSDIADILSAIDMLVVPSIEPEPLSLALLEAMATGKVVLASSHGGPAEVITDGKDGRLFEPGNYHELASAILMLINDPKGAERMGMEGRKRVESGLDLESYIKAVHRAVSSVLK